MAFGWEKYSGPSRADINVYHRQGRIFSSTGSIPLGSCLFLYLFLPGVCWHMPDAKAYSGGCITKENQEIQGENEKNSFI